MNKLMKYDEVNETISTMKGRNHIVAVRTDPVDGAVLYAIVSDEIFFAVVSGGAVASWSDGEEED